VIRAVGHYVRDEAAPRAYKIVFSTEFFVAVALGIATALWGDSVNLADAKIGDIVAALLTYAAIAFGFCLSGLTVALTLPNDDFVRYLAKSTPEAGKFDAYSDLMFVFSWTALIHWIDVVALVAILVVAGSDHKVLPHNSSPEQKALVGLLTFFVTYGIFQFMLTLITLTQVGRVYVRRLNETKKAS
jgi:hypothetical protein